MGAHYPHSTVWPQVPTKPLPGAFWEDSGFGEDLVYSSPPDPPTSPDPPRKWEWLDEWGWCCVNCRIGARWMFAERLPRDGRAPGVGRLKAAGGAGVVRADEVAGEGTG